MSKGAPHHRKLEGVVEPLECAQQELREIRAMCDVLFTFVGRENSVEELLPGSLSSYLSRMLDSCDSLHDHLEKVEHRASTQPA